MFTPDSIQEPPGNLVDLPIENPANRLLQPQPATHLMQPFHPDLYYGAKLPLTNPDGWQPGRPVPFSPPGLENLIQIDQILVQYKADSCDGRNKYQIKNIKGQNIFTAIEDTTFCSTFCCGPVRPFNLKIRDSEEREVMNLHRPSKCQGCLFPCCLQSMQVTASGVVCGYIKQTWSLWQPKFNVCDASGETVLRIKGPFNICACGSSSQKLFTDTIQFGISFPMDLDVKIKAVLLGACLLIDSIYLIC